MANPGDKVAFVLQTNAHGSFIGPLLHYGSDPMQDDVYEPAELNASLALLDLRRKYAGDGVVVVDCGANVGLRTVEWARRMTKWGSVVAIEAQQELYYCLCGNIVLNNCLNARAIHGAIGTTDGTMEIPKLDYHKAGRFGSVELKPRANREYIGQDYGAVLTTVPALRIDTLGLARVDYMKIDVEGMEIDAIEGARATIERCHPVLTVETIKTDRSRLATLLDELGYRVFQVDNINVGAVHRSDPVANHVKWPA